MIALAMNLDYIPIPTAIPLELSIYDSPPPFLANSLISRAFSLLFL